VFLEYKNIDRELVYVGSHAVCLPDSDALNPVYKHIDIIGLGAAAFSDPTTMAIIKVRCSQSCFDRWKLREAKPVAETSKIGIGRP
jgi:hypothetical protein